jgi:hypothetical protein
MRYSMVASEVIGVKPASVRWYRRVDTDPGAPGVLLRPPSRIVVNLVSSIPTKQGDDIS